LRTRGNLVTERAGINYVRTVVESDGCLFKEVNLQHDFGHDATIVIVVDGEVQPREVALQVKSGRSYNKKGACQLPATAGHIDFWARHDLITLGVVYDPDQDTAHWVDLQADSRERRQQRMSDGATIVFSKDSWNRFDPVHFPTVVVPTLLGSAPTVPIATALAWATETDPGTHDMGVRTLLARHKEESATWTCLLEAFRRRSVDALSIDVPLAFARLLGHCDIGDYTGQISEDVRQPVREATLAYGYDEIAKLLLMLPEAEGFDRGGLGYAFLPLLGGRRDSQDLLRKLRDDEHQDEEVRSKAEFLISWYEHDPQWWSFWRRAV